MSAEKTEQPTEQRLQEAQGKGQVLRSHELQQALTLAVALWALSLSGPKLVQALLEYLRMTLHTLDDGARCDLTDLAWLSPLLGLCFWAFVPIFALSGMVGAAMALMLTKGRLKTSLWGQGLERFNLLQNLARWFSKHSVVELVRLALKVILLWKATAVTFETLGEPIYSLRLTNVHQAQAVAAAMRDLLHRLLGLALAVGALDLLYQRWDYFKSLMMTKTEVKDEYKRSEGDPMVKWRRRSFGRKLIKKCGMHRLPEATVLITNPTHYAVALKYDATMSAPQVICKGVDALALEIRRRALELGVNIVEDKPLARALYKVELDSYIPEELFEAAARVLLAVRKAESYFR